MATHDVLLFFSLFLLAIFAKAADKVNHREPSSTTLPLTSHLDNVQSKKKTTQTTQITWIESIIQTQKTDTTRVKDLSNSLAASTSTRKAGGTTVPIPLRKIGDSPTYTVVAKIGKSIMRMAIDTSHSVSFVPCTKCEDCLDAGKHLYTPSNTIKCINRTLCDKVSKEKSCRGIKAPCSFSIRYSASTIWADLVQDTIVLGNYTIPGYTFGCMENVVGTTFPAQGMLGLGPQSLSLLSQTDATFNSRFSYCFWAPSSKSRRHNATLKLGDKYQLYKNKMQTTTLIVNPNLSSYFVKLTGIMVDGKVLKITPSRGRDQEIGNGTVFDSGTVYSVLVESAYKKLRKVIQNRMDKQPHAKKSSLGGFDTCYNIPVNVNNITLIFPGMNLTLNKESFLIKRKSSPVSCLAMSGSSASVINVIGSYQQQNRRVLFDIPNSKLGVVPENCI